MNCKKKGLGCKWQSAGQFKETNTKYAETTDHISVVPSLDNNTEIEIINESPAKYLKLSSSSPDKTAEETPKSTYNEHNPQLGQSLEPGGEKKEDRQMPESMSELISPGDLDLKLACEEETSPEMFRDLNDALRSYMFSTAKTIEDIEVGPEPEFEPITELTDVKLPLPSNEQDLFQDPGTMALLCNYIMEVAPWLDMFDHDSHFGSVIPHLAHSSPALMYAILAISSRQAERRGTDISSESTTLELYQKAIHNLLPSFERLEVSTVAACVILCVLEMMSSSPSSWRKHLEGCAALFSAAGINGFTPDSICRSLFWCFARMDLSCSIIEEESPIISCENWLAPQAPGMTVTRDAACGLFTGTSAPHPPKAAPHEMYANYAVFLGARVSELLQNESPRDPVYAKEWNDLWVELMSWETNRPAELLPLAIVEHATPFPTILYTNGPAISGNQMFHTAAIRMLLARPKASIISKSAKSVLWHARQICGISQTNDHHGCLNNALQPLWIAGRQMSHHTEHKVILDMLERIENTTGWAMRWRGEDLKEFWGIQ